MIGALLVQSIVQACVSSSGLDLDIDVQFLVFAGVELFVFLLFSVGCIVVHCCSCGSVGYRNGKSPSSLSSDVLHISVEG